MTSTRRSPRRLVRAIAGVGVLALLAGCTSTAGTAAISPVGSPSGASPAATTAGIPGPTAAGAASGTPATPVPAADTRPPLNLPTLPDIVSPTPVAATRTDQLAQAMSDSGTATLQQAIDVYSLTVAPLPGATPFSVPAGRGFSATKANALITQFSNQLSPAQSAIVDARKGTLIGSIPGPIGAPSPTASPTASPSGSATASPTASPSGSPTASPAASPTAGPTTVPTTPSGLRAPGQAFVAAAAVRPREPVRRAPTPTPTPTPPAPYQHYLTLLRETRSDWAAQHPELIGRVGSLDLLVSPVDLPVAPETPDVLRDMDSGPSTYVRGDCEITLFPAFFTEHNSDAVVKFIFAHELFHCIQVTWGYTGHLPDWLIEGSAEWAAMDLYRTTPVPITDQFDQWFTNPGTSLGAEGPANGYDAWPLFEAFQEQFHTSPYPAIQAMITAGGSTAGGNTAGGTTAALLAAGGLDGPVFAQLWSSSSIRSTSFPEKVFHLDWPGTSPDFPAAEHDILVPEEARGVGSFAVVEDGPFRHVSYSLPFTGDVGLVGLSASGGSVMTRDDGGPATVADGNQRWFCVKAGGCTCPDGKRPTVAFTQLTGPMLLSFPAQAADTTAQLDSLVWDTDRYCFGDPAPPTGPGDAETAVGGPSATSNGDPHLTTFDGLLYDFMTLGEFVAAQDPSGGFTVQERHQPAGFGTAVSAVAVGDGSHRVTFTAASITPQAAITVRADGATTTAEDVTAGGLSVSPAGSSEGWTISWPDGSAAQLQWNDGFFLTVQPSAARAARIVGILGKPDGDFLDDLTMPDGSPASPTDHYQAFAQAWWVTDATSLFDYDSGQRTETFRVPPATLPAVRPPTVQALTSCREGLGQHATTGEIDDCAYDVTATGQTSLVPAYRAQVDQRQSQVQQEPPAEPAPPRIVVGTASPLTSGPSSGAAGSSPAAPAPGGAPTGSITLSGTLPADSIDAPPGQEPTGHLHLIQGTVVIAQVDCPAGLPDFDLEVQVGLQMPDGSTSQSSAGVCGELWKDDGYQAGPGHEAAPGEAYLLIETTGDYTIVLHDETATTLPGPVPITARILADPAPTIATEPLPTTGVTKTLATGSSLVVLLRPGSGATWTIDGGTAVCGQVYYIPGPSTSDTPSSPWDLSPVCWHHTQVSVGPSDSPIPLVIFNRTDSPTTVTVRRTG